MPRRPKLPCRRSGCPELVEPGEGYCNKCKANYKRKCSVNGCKEMVGWGKWLCPEHKRERDRQQRGNRSDKKHDRFYDTKKWRNLRTLKLNKDPLCERCKAKGLTVAATIVHHKEEIRKGGEYLPTLEELESLCLPCHSRQHGGYRGRGGTLDG